MGYDMYMLRTPEGNLGSYKPQFDEQPECWRFAGGGMQAMLEVMVKARVIDLNFRGAPAVTDWPPPGTIPAERAEELGDWAWWGEASDNPPTESEMRLLKPWLEEVDGWRRTTSQDPDRVAAFKFCTNDGWIVSPAECTIIANGLHAGVRRSHGPFGWFTGIIPSPRRSGISRAEAEVWILNWAAFNRVAAQNDGYSVR
jgi:hypothetical protein